MKHLTILVASVAAFTGTGALAQGFSGGELTLEYVTPSDDGADGDITVLSGGLEYGLTRSFSLAANLQSYRAEGDDEDLYNATIHGIYHLNEAASVGLFVGQDRAEDADLSLYGVEAGYEGLRFEVGGYLGRGDDEGIDYAILGLDTAFALTDAISITGGVSSAGTDGFAIAAAEIGAAYSFNDSIDFYGQVGSIGIDASGDGEVDDDAGYVALGLTVTFGADRGTTFGARGVTQSSFGF